MRRTAIFSDEGGHRPGRADGRTGLVRELAETKSMRMPARCDRRLEQRYNKTFHPR